MKYFYPKFQNLHKPKLDLSDGLPGCEHLEISKRVDGVLKGLLSAYEADVVYVEDLDISCVKLIHDDNYVDFLVKIESEIEDGVEYIPSIFRDDLSDAPLLFRGGMYSKEIGTPIMNKTITAALNTANTTLKAAEYVLERDSSAFVLARPPGHHAGVKTYGGYCFFNNAYIGVEKLLNVYNKVSVVDIDYHIGDGSIEFSSKKAPYYSINACEKTNYPYLDANFNPNANNVKIVNFKDKTTGFKYVKMVEKLLEEVVNDGCDAIVLSLGFDTLAKDGYQDDKIYVEVADFKVIGEIFGRLKQNILIVFEGGYDAKQLELCGYNFMDGFGRKKGFITC